MSSIHVKEKIKNIKTHKLFLIVVFLLIAIPTAIFYVRAPFIEGTIINAADKYNPSQLTWTEGYTEVKGPGFCIDVTCPSVKKWWRSEGQIHTTDKFQKIATIDSIPMKVDVESCLQPAGRTGVKQSFSGCRAELILDGYRYELSYNYGTLVDGGSDLFLFVVED